MKHLICMYLLLFQLVAFSQTDSNISVVSIENVNTVYRGITNRIKIAVPMAKSFKVEALGVLTKVDSLGNYDWSVTGVGGRKATVKIDIVMPDNTMRHEAKEFDIKEISRPRGTIISDYGWHTYEMTREQLSNLKLGVTIDNFNIKRDSLYAIPVGFVLSIPRFEDIMIEGNSMNEEAKLLINELSIGSIVYIKDICQYNPHDYCFTSLPDIKIKVIDGFVEEIIIPKPIISLKYRNVLYRGVNNEFEIAVPGSKSFKVSAPGLIKNEYGGYSWDVAQIKTATTVLHIDVVTENDSVFRTYEEFRIKDAGSAKATLNGNGCNNCVIEITKEELKEAKVGISLVNFISTQCPVSYVKEYILVLPDGNLYRVGEDGFSYSAQKMIVQFPNGSIFRIKDIKFTVSGCDLYIKPELKFMLVDNHD